MAAKRQVEYSRAAGNDLESIKRHIDVDSPKAAARVLGSILAAAGFSGDGQALAARWHTQAGTFKISLLDYLPIGSVKGDRFSSGSSVAQAFNIARAQASRYNSNSR